MQELKHSNIIIILKNFVHFLVYILVTVIIGNQVGALDKVTTEEIYIGSYNYPRSSILYIPLFMLIPTSTCIENI